MIVTAYLAWYDEPKDQLARCVRSMTTIADRLVALDGGYARYPGAAPASPKGQADTIRETAKQVGLGCKVVVPTRLWAGQCEKRTELLNMAARGSDWIVGVDADHILHGVRYTVRRELEQLVAADTIDVDFYTPMNNEKPIEDTASGDWHRNLAGKWSTISGIFRALRGWKVEERHWWYSALKGRQRVWMWAGDMRYPSAPVHQMAAPYFVEHQCLLRQPKQIIRNRRFCLDRDELVRTTDNEDPVLVPA